jgi:hypothetical protein
MGHSREEYWKRADAREPLCLKYIRDEGRIKRARNRKRQEERYQEAESQQASTADTVEGEHMEAAMATFGMAVARDARELAYTVNALTCGCGLKYQRAVLDKFLQQPLLQVALLAAVVERDERKQCRLVCKGIADAWAELKYGVGRDRYLAWNVIEAAVISVGDGRSSRAVGQCIGLNRRILRRAIRRRRSLNDWEEGAVWAKKDRKKRRDALSQETIDAVVRWWTEETWVSL